MFKDRLKNVMMKAILNSAGNRFIYSPDPPGFSGSPTPPGEPRNPPISPHRRAQKNTPKPDRKIHLLKGPRHPENPQKPGKGHRIWNSGVPGGSGPDPGSATLARFLGVFRGAAALLINVFFGQVLVCFFVRGGVRKCAPGDAFPGGFRWRKTGGLANFHCRYYSSC